MVGDRPRRTGIEVVGDVPWGRHFCQFYETAGDLADTLVPYFREGLLANEFCFSTSLISLRIFFIRSRSRFPSAIPGF